MSVSWTLVQFLCTRPSVANPKEELEGKKEKREIERREVLVRMDIDMGEGT